MYDFFSMVFVRTLTPYIFLFSHKLLFSSIFFFIFFIIRHYKTLFFCKNIFLVEYDYKFSANNFSAASTAAFLFSSLVP